MNKTIEPKKLEIAPIHMEAVEKALVMGNLASLNPEQRVSYYNAICASMGLNPLTRPFDYITLGGKLVLYARKDCTDQLRRIYGVSCVLKSQKTEGDLFIVNAGTRDPNGKEDEDIGAVSIKGLFGESLANAYMKGVTKAKRRATLSHCGLGMLDESELDSIPEAREQLKTQNVAQKTENKTEALAARIVSSEKEAGEDKLPEHKPRKPAALQKQEAMAKFAAAVAVVDAEVVPENKPEPLASPKPVVPVDAGPKPPAAVKETKQSVVPFEPENSIVPFGMYEGKMLKNLESGEVASLEHYFTNPGAKAPTTPLWGFKDTFLAFLCDRAARAKEAAQQTPSKPVAADPLDDEPASPPTLDPQRKALAALNAVKNMDELRAVWTTTNQKIKDKEIDLSIMAPSAANAFIDEMKKIKEEKKASFK